MANEIRIDGTKRLQRRLQALDARTRGAVLASIVERSAKVVRDVAAQKAPIRTGHLQETMTVELLERRPNRASAGVGPHKSAWYGRFAEYGTVKQAARPFLRPAYDEKKRDTSRAMARDLRRQIQKARRV